MLQRIHAHAITSAAQKQSLSFRTQVEGKREGTNPYVRAAVGLQADGEGKRNGARAGEGSDGVVSQVWMWAAPSFMQLQAMRRSAGGGRHVAEPAHAVAARARGGRQLPGQAADAPAQGDGHVARPGKTRRRIRDDDSLLPSETLDERRHLCWLPRREKVKKYMFGAPVEDRILHHFYNRLVPTIYFN